jgi:NTP pyrophosphatase (non-canonical NTP hydrolase)
MLSIVNGGKMQKSENQDVLRLLLSKTRQENILICLEELSELQIEITRLERGRTLNTNGLKEEMADVYIILEMLQKMYSISDADLDREKSKKMKRNLNRIKE